jgi:hypothetical protein
MAGGVNTLVSVMSHFSHLGNGSSVTISSTTDSQFMHLKSKVGTISFSSLLLLRYQLGLGMVYLLPWHEHVLELSVQVLVVLMSSLD